MIFMKPVLFLVFAVLTVVFVSGCIGEKGFEYNEVRESPPKMSSPLQVKLSLSDKPLLDKPVKLTLTIKSMITNQNNSKFAFPNTSAKIEIPEGFEFVSGEREWYGNLSANEEQKIDAVIVSKRVGYYKLIGYVNSKQFDGAFGGADIIYVEVSPKDAIIGSRPENNWYEPAQGQAIAVAENNEKIKSELIISQTPELNKEFTITYRVIPQEDILDSRYRQMSIVFPPKAFKIINVEFPEGGKTYKSSSQLSWQGDLKKDNAVEIKATVKVINTGWGSVSGELNIQAGSDGSKFVQDVKVADLYVDKYMGNVTVK